MIDFDLMLHKNCGFNSITDHQLAFHAHWSLSSLEPSSINECLLWCCSVSRMNDYICTVYVLCCRQMHAMLIR